MHFGDALAQKVRDAGNPCCVGIDPHMGLLPKSLADRPINDRLVYWGCGVVDAVANHVVAVKPQSAFFEAHGHEGMEALRSIITHARLKGLHVVLDAKRGDIGSTAKAYAHAGLHPEGPLNADSMTVSPYLGPESLTPFLDVCKEHGKGIWALVRTSNPGAELWQCNDRPSEHLAPAYRIADWIEQVNSEYLLGKHGLGPVGAVVAATLTAHEVEALRSIMRSTWFLVPGYGAQGATAENLRGHFRMDGLGALVVSARGVLFSPDKKPEGDDWKERVAERAAAFAADMQTVMP